MDDVVIDMTDPDTLLAEVRRLKAEISQLHERVELLDRLAHQDVLIDLPNRRGFMVGANEPIPRVSKKFVIAPRMTPSILGTARAAAAARSSIAA